MNKIPQGVWLQIVDKAAAPAIIYEVELKDLHYDNYTFLFRSIASALKKCQELMKQHTAKDFEWKHDINAAVVHSWIRKPKFNDWVVTMTIQIRKRIVN